MSNAKTTQKKIDDLLFEFGPDARVFDVTWDLIAEALGEDATAMRANWGATYTDGTLGEVIERFAK